MNRILAVALAVATMTGPTLAAQEPAEDAAERIALRVLLAGRAGESTHRDEWLGFLSRHFSAVGKTSYSDFKPADADGWDVVVFDAETRPTPGHIGLPPGPKLPEDFDRASVLVSGAGVLLAESLRLKFDWL